MPSSFSPILRTELPALGEQAGTWSTTINNDIGTFLEAAIAGTANHNTAGAADTTLTALNGTADEARNAVIKLTGVLTGSHNVICPSVSKLYLVINNTTGAFTITFKTAAGTGVVVPQGSYMFLYCDGTNVNNSMTSQQLITPTMTAPVLGIPASGTLTNCTGLPISTGVSGLAAGVAAFLATPTSANLATALTDETGTGAAVFATSPTLVTPLLGTPTSGNLANCTGYPVGSLSGTVGIAAGGTGQTTAAAAFTALAGTQSAASSGYVHLGSIIIQWGPTGAIGTNGTATPVFPIAFPTSCDTVILTCVDAIGNNAAFGFSAYGYSTTGFTAKHYSTTGSAQSYQYIAIGH